MAIAFSSKTQQKVAGGNATNTFSHTISGSDTILFVAVSNENAGSMTGVTYNGVAMTEIGTGQGTLHLYYLINPTTGANNVVATRSGTSNDFHAWALSYTGVKQTGQPDADSKATTLTGTVTTVADNCWGIMVARADNAGLAPSTNSTERTTPDGYDAWGVFDTNGVITPAGSFSMSATGGGGLSNVMASFAPAVGSTSLIKTAVGVAIASVKTRDGVANV